MAEVKIIVRKNGPYRVEAPPGAVKLVDADGKEWDLSGKLRPEGFVGFSLCRCGQSASKPFCDGTHGKIGFQAPEGAP